jgi:hypothetical protein
MEYELNNSMDEFSDIDLEDIELEAEFEKYLLIKSSFERMQKLKGKTSKKEKIRRDLYDNIQKIENEPLVRQWASYFLRRVRMHKNNGFQSLEPFQQAKIINSNVKELCDFFGVEDIYFSKRNNPIYDKEEKKLVFAGEKIPLRKELTTRVYQAYLSTSKLLPQ